MVGTYILFGSVAGGIFYDEFSTLSEATALGAAGWALYIGGTLTMLVGLVLIADPSVVAHHNGQQTDGVTPPSKEAPPPPPLAATGQEAPSRAIRGGMERVPFPEKTPIPLTAPINLPQQRSPHGGEEALPRPLRRRHTRDVLGGSAVYSDEAVQRIFTPTASVPPSPFAMVLSSRQQLSGRETRTVAVSPHRPLVGGSAPIRLQSVRSGTRSALHLVETSPDAGAVLPRDTFPMPQMLDRAGVGAPSRGRGIGGSKLRVWPVDSAPATAPSSAQLPAVDECPAAEGVS